MSGFIRRYTYDPGIEEITSIEGVVIIDREPPAAIQGLGTGMVMMVGEFENGPFNTPTEVASGDDLATVFGGLGFTYAGVPANNPCARSRKPDGALDPQYWNGNAFIQLVNKRFRRLSCIRVDTSVGEVNLYRQASVNGGTDFTFALTSGQILSFDLTGVALDATFTGVAATVTSGSGVYPSTFAGGETMRVVIDEGTANQVGPVDVVFRSTDQTKTDVIARLNEAVGYTAFASGAGTTIVLTGRHKGTAGNVKIVSATALVLTATAFAVGSTAGTGNVADISQVTVAEIASLVATATTNAVSVVRLEDGRLRASNVSIAGGSSIEVHANTTATALGFVVGDAAANSAGDDGLIPSGFRVRNVGGDEWVTMQDVIVEAANQGPYPVKVRPADDDGTALGAASLTVTVVPYQPVASSFGVTNVLPLTAALTEAQLDAAYTTALDATLNSNTIAREINLLVPARSSNAVNMRAKSVAIQGSAEGLQGRVAIVSPPLGITTRAIAKSTTSLPGVGAYRTDRVIYAYPGAATFVPQVAARGLDGGAGFTSDGIVDTFFNSWVASTCSQLPPEENPGQETPFMVEIRGIERGNPDVQDLRINDYKAFKASGIAALRMDGATAVVQSGVTSVDPAVHPNLKNIARRRFADFYQDTLAQRLKSFSKKLSTKARWASMLGEINSFCATLKSENNPDSQRIDDYFNDAKTGNTPTTLALGIFRIKSKVRMLADLGYIVLDTEVGENVTVRINDQEAA